MEIKIRNTSKQDFFETENITREAFWNLYKPGCDEHLVLHQIRDSQCYIGKLDFVAIHKGKIIGHIITTKAKVVDRQNKEHEVLCVGPLSVLPEFQKKGAGSELMVESVRIAKEFGFSGMILFGDPEYYHRFGYKNAAGYGITTKDGQNFEPFMALELQVNGFKNVKGKFYEDPAFEVDPEDLTRFEKLFPYKEKHEASKPINSGK